MVDPTSESDHGTSRASSNGPIEPDRGIGELIDDLVTLTDLQVRLAVVDLKENARRAAVPLWLAFWSLIVMAASVSVVLAGLALLLATRSNLHPGWAMIIVAAAAAALASPVLALSIARVGRGCDGFWKSRAELRRNLAWLRTVLVTPTHSISNVELNCQPCARGFTGALAARGPLRRSRSSGRCRPASGSCRWPVSAGAERRRVSSRPAFFIRTPLAFSMTLRSSRACFEVGRLLAQGLELLEPPHGDARSPARGRPA